MTADASSPNSEITSEWRKRYRVAPHLPSLFYLPDYVVPEQEEHLLREIRASKAKWVQLSGRRLQSLGGVVHAKGLIPAPLPAWLQPLLGRVAAEGGDQWGLYGGQPPNHVLVNSYMPGEGIMPHEDGPAYHPVVAILSLGSPAVIRFRRKTRLEDDGPAADGAQGAPNQSADGGHVGGPKQEQRPWLPSSQPPAPPQPYVASLLLQPRSLVVFEGEAFTGCLHCIEEVNEEQLDESVANLGMYSMTPGTTLPRGGERISLTIRRVPRVMPALLRR